MSAKPILIRPWRLTTIVTVTVIVLLGVLLAFTYVTYRNVLENRRNAEIENAMAIGRAMAGELDAFLADIESTTLAMSIGIGGQSGTHSQRSVGPYLKRVIQNYEGVRAIFVTDPSGRVMAADSGIGIGTDLSSRPYLRALRTGTSKTWSDALVGMQSGQVTLTFGRVILYPDGRVRGYLLAAFYPKGLVERLAARLPPAARITLIDRKGFVLHTTYDPDLPVAQRDVSGDTRIREALRGRPVRISERGLAFSQDTRFGALIPIPRTGWVLAVSRPLDPVEMQIRDVALRQAGGIALVATLTALVGLFIGHRLTRPVRTLAQTAEAIARGERPIVPSVRGPAEVLQLAAGMQAMTRAVSEREDTLRFLAEAGKQLSTSLDHETILRNLARLAVPSMADWCVIYLKNDDGSIRRLEVVHDPSKTDLVHRLAGAGALPLDERNPVVQAMKTGKSLLSPEISDTTLRAAARDDEAYQLIKALGLKSNMIVPMVVREQTIGAISFSTAESGRRYAPQHLTIAEELAHRAALAVDNARMYARERGIAVTLQRSLLRKDLPEMPGVTVATRYLPAKTEAEVGGDWYDVFAFPDGRIGMVMGDVAGRGIEAASVMAQLQHALRAYALEGHAPVMVLERLNALLELKDMATLIYLIFDPATWTVTYANAGHLPPLTIAPNGQVSTFGEGSPPLGGSPLTLYRESTVTLTPGSTIVLYTDGLIEVRGESIDVGMARLAQVVTERGGGDLEALLDRILSVMLNSEGAADDVALLALRAEALDPARIMLRIPATPNSLPLVRHTLRRWLTQAGATSEDIYDISVATAEACANSIEHAYQAADARLEIEATLQDGQIIVTVRDWGQWREPRGKHRGRGLILMRGLMDAVQVIPSDGGTTVQMRRRLKREVRA
jgi:serine phosphatase RsbU (regulator of sigma subunit)/anti-sigma regulatory factor (Ser/Thr protein kinase)